jgi:hypothetical protein
MLEGSPVESHRADNAISRYCKTKLQLVASRQLESKPNPRLVASEQLGIKTKPKTCEVSRIELGPGSNQENWGLLFLGTRSDTNLLP